MHDSCPILDKAIRCLKLTRSMGYKEGKAEDAAVRLMSIPEEHLDHMEDQWYAALVTARLSLEPQTNEEMKQAHLRSRPLQYVPTGDRT